MKRNLGVMNDNKFNNNSYTKTAKKTDIFFLNQTSKNELNYNKNITKKSIVICLYITYSRNFKKIQ
jgi:hypothetical protein